jgi:uncharacterized membrane protein YqjE
VARSTTSTDPEYRLAEKASHAAIAFVVALFLVLAGVFGWMASQSRKMFTNAAKEIAKDIRENTVAVKALSERIEKMER